MIEDPVAESTKDLRAWRVRVREGEAKKFTESILKNSAAMRAEVLVLRSDMVFGEDHLRSALYHARKAMAEGRSVSESLAIETLLYASGERQLSNAIKKMGAPGHVEEVVVAVLSGTMGAPGPSWQPLPRLVEADLAKLREFGFTEQELSTSGTRRPEELVLERVAAVDTVKR